MALDAIEGIESRQRAGAALLHAGQATRDCKRGEESLSKPTTLLFDDQIVETKNLLHDQEVFCAGHLNQRVCYTACRVTLPARRGLYQCSHLSKAGAMFQLKNADQPLILKRSTACNIWFFSSNTVP